MPSRMVKVSSRVPWSLRTLPRRTYSSRPEIISNLVIDCLVLGGTRSSCDRSHNGDLSNNYTTQTVGVCDSLLPGRGPAGSNKMTTVHLALAGLTVVFGLVRYYCNRVSIQAAKSWCRRSSSWPAVLSTMSSCTHSGVFLAQNFGLLVEYHGAGISTRERSTVGCCSCIPSTVMPCA